MTYRLLAASLAASFALAAPAMAATSASSQYSSWAGSQANADALVAGLRNGTPVTLATRGADGSRSIAGFTPATSMSAGEVNRALRSAQRSLARMGISNPTAEQIQAALIGGEVALPNGKAQELRGTVAARGGNPQLAAR